MYKWEIQAFAVQVGWLAHTKQIMFHLLSELNVTAKKW